MFSANILLRRAEKQEQAKTFNCQTYMIKQINQTRFYFFSNLLDVSASLGNAKGIFKSAVGLCCFNHELISFK